MLVIISRDMSKYPLADRGLSDEALIIKVFSCRRSFLSSVTSSFFLAFVHISSTVSYPDSTELVTAKRFKFLATSWKVENNYHIFTAFLLVLFGSTEANKRVTIFAIFKWPSSTSQMHFKSIALIYWHSNSRSLKYFVLFSYTWCWKYANNINNAHSI